MSIPKIPISLTRKTALGKERMPVYFVYSEYSVDTEGFKRKLREAGLVSSGAIREDDQGRMHLSTNSLPLALARFDANTDPRGHLYAPRGRMQVNTKRQIYNCAKTELGYTNNAGQQFELLIWNVEELNRLPARITVRFDGQLIEDWAFAYPVLTEYLVKDEGKIVSFIGADRATTMTNFGVIEREMHWVTTGPNGLETQLVKDLRARFRDVTEPIQFVCTNYYQPWELTTDQLGVCGLATSLNLSLLQGYKKASDQYSFFLTEEQQQVVKKGAPLEGWSSPEFMQRFLSVTNAEQKALLGREIDEQIRSTNKNYQGGLELDFRMMNATNVNQKVQLIESLIKNNPKLSERQKKRILKTLQKDEVRRALEQK